MRVRIHMHKCTLAWAYQNTSAVIDIQTGIYITIDMHSHAERLHSVFMSVVTVLETPELLKRCCTKANTTDMKGTTYKLKLMIAWLHCPLSFIQWSSYNPSVEPYPLTRLWNSDTEICGPWRIRCLYPGCVIYAYFSPNVHTTYVHIGEGETVRIPGKQELYTRVCNSVIQSNQYLRT